MESELACSSTTSGGRKAMTRRGNRPVATWSVGVGGRESGCRGCSVGSRDEAALRAKVEDGGLSCRVVTS